MGRLPLSLATGAGETLGLLSYRLNTREAKSRASISNTTLWLMRAKRNPGQGVSCVRPAAIAGNPEGLDGCHALILRLIQNVHGIDHLERAGSG